MAGTSVIRTSILGQLPSGEVWSVNPCWFCLDEPADITASEALAIATAIDAITIATGLRAVMSTSTSFTGTRVEARDRDGTLRALGEHTRATAILGTGTNNHPFQIASVTSLRTAFPGASGRGRLYWPATAALLNSATLRMDSTAQTNLLSGVKAYLLNIQSAVAASAGPVSLSVWSRKGSAFHGVTTLRQGDVLDTQRRRRDTLTESYVEGSFP